MLIMHSIVTISGAGVIYNTPIMYIKIGKTVQFQKDINMAVY